MSFEDLLDKARSGDSEAQYDLGLIYADEENEHFDFYEAIFWMIESAENGYQHAKDWLNELYGSEDPRAEAYD
jgi:TPR repeat protein